MCGGLKFYSFTSGGWWQNFLSFLTQVFSVGFNLSLFFKLHFNYEKPTKQKSCALGAKIVKRLNLLKTIKVYKIQSNVNFRPFVVTMSLLHMRKREKTTKLAKYSKTKRFGNAVTPAFFLCLKVNSYSKNILNLFV